MELLKKKILDEGIALDKNILKVDSFLNHQVDVNLMMDISTEFYNYFKIKKINKIVTIESSGIAPAFATAVPSIISFKPEEMM